MIVMLPTHIEIDKPSKFSGRIYTNEVVSNLVSSNDSSPALFGSLERNDGFSRIVFCEDERQSMEMYIVGYDIIQDRLWVKISCDDAVADTLYSKSYNVWLLCNGFEASNDVVIQVGKVVGAVVEEVI